MTNKSTPSNSVSSENAVLAELRIDYRLGELREGDLSDDPLAEFAGWLDRARDAHVPGTDEPHAMTLATADSSGHPSARTVLLKGVDARGFTWFTNYASRKGRELAQNPYAALNFRWGSLERQVVVMGPVTRVSDSESDEYFYSRPLGSRIGAIVSAQSTVVVREELEAAAEALAKLPDAEIRRPAHWGGFRLTPMTIEFWQGRSSRLHDRIRFQRNDADSPWVKERLAP